MTTKTADAGPSYAEQIEAAQLALSRSDRPAAAAAFHAAIDVARGDPALQRELVPTLVQLGKLEQELGRPAEAERLFTDALQIGEAQFGAEHASLANALTGLALVKRALGDVVAAEQRFRDALRIREKALAPHHMATVVTMEQLSETCAARGNLDEALALLRRALRTREAVLGSEHATVRALQSRVAGLELRITEDTIASEPQPQPAQPPAAAHTPVTPVSSPRRSRRRRVGRFASVGVTAIALATAGLSVGSRSGVGNDDVSANAGTAMRVASLTTASTTNRAIALGAAAMASLVHPDSTPSANETSTPIAPAEQPTSASATPPARPRLPVLSKNLAAITARLIANTNVDSLVRASTKLGREFITDQIGVAGGLQIASPLEGATAKPAALVAPAPSPRFPDELRAQWTEGEVVVQFRVDERGRVDVSSVKVLKSDHELFTAAVRNVLPRFRFEPARSPAPESKPIADWVDYRVRFAATK